MNPRRIARVTLPALVLAALTFVGPTPEAAACRPVVGTSGVSFCGSLPSDHRVMKCKRKGKSHHARCVPVRRWSR